MGGIDLSTLTLATDGGQLFCGVLSANEISKLQRAADGAGRIRSGRRIYQADEFLAGLLDIDGAVGAIAARILSKAAKPVRVLMFDKTPGSNWNLAWHEDRVIAVAERREAPGFGPRSTKDAVAHVAPPIDVLAKMITIRVHLDDCGDDNSPLLIAVGSHQIGKVPAALAASVAGRHVIAACRAKAGDLWVYSTPILHASEPARTPGRRRVLQVDYADFELPSGLRWFGLNLASKDIDRDSR